MNPPAADIERESAASPAWWQAFRRQMPVAKNWAYFDHAAVAPLSGPAREILGRFCDDAAGHGDAHWKAWADEIEALRVRSAAFVGASPDEIAFVPNTTAGINLVAEGFPWQRGDNVVVPASEFPSNLYPWMNLAEYGVEARLVPAEGGRVDLDRLADACDGRTRLISASWVGYATGWRLDLDALAELARRRGVYLFVDAIQGLGVFPLDVRRTPIDFLAADGHKWLLGPEGAGLFFVRREHLELLRPRGVGWHSVAHAGDYANTRFTLRAAASRYEGGTWNTAGILALGASLDLLAGMGATQIAARVLEVTDLACRRLEQIGAQLASAREPPHGSGIVAFDVPGKSAQAVRQHCLRGGVALACRGGKLRISPHAYNNASDVDRLVEVLSSA